MSKERTKEFVLPLWQNVCIWGYLSSFFRLLHNRGRVFFLIKINHKCQTVARIKCEKYIHLYIPYLKGRQFTLENLLLCCLWNILRLVINMMTNCCSFHKLPHLHFQSCEPFHYQIIKAFTLICYFVKRNVIFHHSIKIARKNMNLYKKCRFITNKKKERKYELI